MCLSPLSPGQDVAQVLDPGRPVEERPDNAAPAGKVLRLAEPDRVRFQAVPLDEQHEPRRRFDAAGTRAERKPGVAAMYANPSRTAATNSSSFPGSTAKSAISSTTPPMVAPV